MDEQTLLKLTGKRNHRTETPSEAVHVECVAHKADVKKNRTDMRKYRERKQPRYMMIA